MYRIISDFPLPRITLADVTEQRSFWWTNDFFKEKTLWTNGIAEISVIKQ